LTLGVIFDKLSAQKILNKGIRGCFITFCINFCYERKKGDFLDLWSHYLKSACSEERVGDRSMSTLNNILRRFPWLFSLAFMTYWVMTYFSKSLLLGLHVTKLHMSKLTTFVFLGRLAWLFNSIILIVRVSKKYNKTNHKDSRSILASSNTLSKCKEARDGPAGCSRTALRLAMGLSLWLSQDCPLPSLYILNYLLTDEPIVMELSKGLKKGVGNKFVEVF